MNYHKLSKEVRRFVTGYFESRPDPRLYYHNFGHTERVVRAAEEIAGYYTYEGQQLFIVTTAAWFHDLGYLTGMVEHEQRGADLARSFLSKYEVDDTVIGQIENAILATRLPHKPSTELEEILCDADLYELGTSGFNDSNKQYRKEQAAFNSVEKSRIRELETDLVFLEEHHFFTAYCRNLLDGQLAINISRIKGKLHKIKEHEADTALRTERRDKPERGVETMFRITAGNNQRLSNMADNKAHILITVNSIMLSAIISLLLRKLDTNQYLILPTMILLAVCLGALVFSILATRPSIPKGIYTPAQVKNKTVNLLFFGNFYRMHIEDYTNSMFEAMDDSGILYGMLIRDVFTQGVVLGRKYRYLRLAYNVFMYGLIMAVMAFTVASILNRHHGN